jgi:hypothetical protein
MQGLADIVVGKYDGSLKVGGCDCGRQRDDPTICKRQRWHEPVSLQCRSSRLSLHGTAPCRFSLSDQLLPTAVTVQQQLGA